MSRFTDQLYRTWLGQNGYAGPRRSTLGGMGGVPPMTNQQPSITTGDKPRCSAAANDDTYSRPDKRDCDYVDNIIEIAQKSLFEDK